MSNPDMVVVTPPHVVFYRYSMPGVLGKAEDEEVVARLVSILHDTKSLIWRPIKFSEFVWQINGDIAHYNANDWPVGVSKLEAHAKPLSCLPVPGYGPVALQRALMRLIANGYVQRNEKDDTLIFTSKLEPIFKSFSCSKPRYT